MATAARSYTKLNELARTVVEATDYQIATDTMLEVNREVGQFIQRAHVNDNGTNAVLWGDATEAQRIAQKAQTAWEAIRESTWGEK